MTVLLDPWPAWPTFGWCDDVRPALRDVVAQGRPAALATLFATRGGAPRPPGTQMLLAEGALAGFFSGGCVEADVACHAAEVIATGAPRRLVYGAGSPWLDIRLLCGARIDIVVERLTSDDPAAARLLDLGANRRTALWVSDGDHRVCLDQDEEMPFGLGEALPPGDHAFRSSEHPFAIARRFEPRPRLVVVGADPTAMAIAYLGARTGFETTLVHSNGRANPPPLSGVAYSRSDPAQAFEVLGLDRWTAIVVATHDLDVDEAALAAALPSQASYVGVLGAARRLPERLARLRVAGLPEVALARLRGPVGLPIGGKAPWEIAVSVVAEIIQQRNGGR